MADANRGEASHEAAGTDVHRGDAEAKPSPGRRRRRGLGAAMVGMVLLVTGAATAVSAAPDGPRPARRVGPDIPVNRVDLLDTSARNSPALVVNPANATNLVVVDRVMMGPRSSCSMHLSLDGGSNWVERPLPLPNPDAPISCVSPDAAFGADGTLYLTFATFGTVADHGNVPDGVWLVTSRDEGRTLLPATRVSGPLAFQLGITADPEVAGRLWLVWLQATRTGGYGLSSTGDPIVVSRSDDSGTSWGAPVRASGAGRQRIAAPDLAVGPGGTLLLAYLDLGEDRLDYAGGHEARDGEPYPGRWSLVVARSADRGATWAESVLDDRLVPTQRFAMLRPPRPSLAFDGRRDRAYVAFHDGRRGSADVRVWASDAAGRRWGPGRRVNDTAEGDRSAQWLPALDVAPDGRLDVAYYDRRGGNGRGFTGISLQSSYDGGRTFSPSAKLTSVRFDPLIGPVGDGGIPDLGDRLGLVSTDSGALAMWTDTRAGLPTTGKQDLARAVAAVEPPPAEWGPVRLGGVGLGVVGLLVLLASLGGRRRRGRNDAVAPAAGSASQQPVTEAAERSALAP